MSSQPKDSSGEENLPQHSQQLIEGERRRAILTQQIKRDLETNPRYKDYFATFDPQSVRNFIEEYSWRKVFYLEHGKRRIESDENDLLRFEAEGTLHFWNIQRKKLFDLECLWRAEKIKLPGVELTWDFRYWEHHLERCPFLRRVTEEEVEAYVSYVLSDRFEEEEPMSWDDMKYMIGTDGEDDVRYPAWYEFHDGRFKTESPFKLPDIRGEKEAFYRELAHSKEREKTRERVKDGAREDNRPPIEYRDPAVIEAFIRKFEDEKILRYFQAIISYETRHRDDKVQSAIEILQCADAPVPMEGSDDWREGLIKTADNFHRKRLAEGVRAAYRQYQLRLDSGVFIENGEKDNFMEAVRNEIKEDIITGRVINGEPPDLNL